MKPLLTNRSIQWVLVIILGLGSTLIVDKLMKSEGTTSSAIIATETFPSETISPPTPKPLNITSNVPLSNRIVEYHMAVSLYPEKKALQAAQTVTWQNPGAKPVQELYFHLYPNAFASMKTTFNRESGGKLRQDEMKSSSFGSMTVQTMQTLQGEDLSGHMSFVQPDDGNTNDKSLMKLTLFKPVAPGEKITLSMDFLVNLPAVYARMGYADDFYMAGQWFPKIAVYEPVGVRGRTEEGWNLHQYHGNSEFYADFGIYDVKISVPTAFTVAATGFPIKAPAEANGTRMYHFYADDVHDFAWAASSQFIYYEEPFSTANIPGVKIKLYLDPKHADLKTRYMQAAKKSLSRYSEWYGSYPYSTLSIVVPPENGNGAGGMEYPTLVTAWGAADAKPDLELERVVVHEIGHQYWYGMVASNEFEEAWLDEGFTSYAEEKVMEKEYGAKPNHPLEASYITSPEPLLQNAWDYRQHDVYADNVYIRAKLVLNTIEKESGTVTMNQILKKYFQRWRFRHPTTKDFQNVVEEVTKKSWGDFFNQFVYGGLMIDYAVENIQVSKAQTQGRTTYESEVLIRKRGADSRAVPIEFHFRDGSKVEKIWDVQGSEIRYKLSATSPVEWVMVDPQHTLLLENKHMNNFMKTEVDPQWKARWNIGITKLLETLFAWVTW